MCGCCFLSISPVLITRTEEQFKEESDEMIVDAIPPQEAQEAVMPAVPAVQPTRRYDEGVLIVWWLRRYDNAV